MKVRFGICADLHTDYIHDAEDRFRSFLETARESECDFLIELGDFCPPGERGRLHKEKILQMMAEYDRPIYHVLGNHDMDENDKGGVLSYLNTDRPYYSFDVGGVHFAVLDTCYFRDGELEKSYEYGNYKKAESTDVAIASEEMLAWLEDDLASSKYPAVLFSHHSLIESRTGIGNPEALRRVIKNAPCGVILSACGHEHVDRIERRDGVYYWCVNSMSYYWAGGKYSHTTYGDDIESEYPLLRQVFPYRDPIFAIVEIEDNEIKITGRESMIVGALPFEMSFTKVGLVDEITASIIDRDLSM